MQCPSLFIDVNGHSCKTAHAHDIVSKQISESVVFGSVIKLAVASCIVKRWRCWTLSSHNYIMIIAIKCHLRVKVVSLFLLQL